VRVGNILFVTTKELAAAMLSNPDFGPGATGNRSVMPPRTSYLGGPTVGTAVPFAPPAPLPPAPAGPPR
jgi:hypothetical protein